MVRTGNVDFSCKRLTSIEIRKSKYHIIRRVRFRWETPPPPPEKDIWIRACTHPHTHNVYWFRNKLISTERVKSPHNHLANIHSHFTKINLANIMNDFNRKYLHSPCVSTLDCIKYRVAGFCRATS